MADTQLIKDKLDLVQFISEYLPLKKAGTYWKANCPFHQEKSPSFMVHPERQFWRCFGCNKGGDIFDFLQEMEGMDFPEALKLLADRAGIKLETYRNEIEKSQKNRILEINQKAAYFFHHFLLEMSGAVSARQYLERRELKSETISNWQVGFIPEQWDLLTQYLLKKGCGIEELVSAGLTIKKDGASAPGRGYYDRFRGRIMFPIWDVHGNVVGFTGRVLVEKENSGGKYVNTPQTAAYDKSRVLYGLDKAKTEIRTKDLAVIVEGQMDVIACHQAGMKNVVAASGTALTPDQVRLLKRYTNNLAMAFDADSAGTNAAKRGIDIAVKEGMSVRVIRIPVGAGKDADECLKKNPAVWFRAVADATEIMRWFFDTALLNKDLSSPKNKQAIADELLPLIGLIPFAVERDHWLQQLSGILGADVSVLREDLKRVQKLERQPTNTANQSVASPAPVKSVNSDRLEMLRERLFLALLKYPILASGLFTSLKEGNFLGSVYYPLYEWLKKGYTNDGLKVFDAKEWLISAMPEMSDILAMRAELEYADFNESAARQEIEILSQEINDIWVKRSRQELQKAIAEAEKNGDSDLVAKLVDDFQKIN